MHAHTFTLHLITFDTYFPIQAGLITELKSTNIEVILEGDAAYCFCRELITKSDFKTHLDLSEIEEICKSNKVLVADIGGTYVSLNIDLF